MKKFAMKAYAGIEAVVGWVIMIVIASVLLMICGIPEFAAVAITVYVGYGFAALMLGILLTDVEPVTPQVVVMVTAWPLALPLFLAVLSIAWVLEKMGGV